MVSEIGYGTTLIWNTDEVEETVVGLTRIGAVKLTLGKVDSTTLTSPNYYREMLPGLIDPGDVEIEGFFRPDDATGQYAILADMNARVKRKFAVIFPAALSGVSWTGEAYITGFEAGDATPEGIIPFGATLSIVGKPALNIGASAGLTGSFFVISNDAVVMPDPANAVYTYIATVLTGVTSVTVTPTAAAGIITVQGVEVTSDEASDPITLGDAGSVTLITIVVTETNKSPKTYRIYLYRASD